MQGPNGEVNGFDVTILVQEPAGSGAFVAVACQRGATFPEKTNAINISSKERREGVFLPGRYEATVTLEALYVPNHSGYLKMRAAMRAGEMITIKRKELGSDLESASAVITSLSPSFPDQDASVISADFQISGPWA